MGFWDIHCHLMPGVDDGAADEGEAVAMIMAAAKGGTEGLAVTPHVDLEGDFVAAHRISEFVKLFSARFASNATQVSLYPGAELRLNWGLRRVAVEEWETLVEFTLAGAGRYLLVDLPSGLVPEAIRETVFRLRLAGMVPVVAHPERHPMLRSGSLLRDLLESGVLLQVNSGSLTGEHGDEVRRRAEWLLREGLVAVVASDAHSAGHRRPDLRGAYDRLVDLAGEGEARRLLEENPRKMIEGEKVTASVCLPSTLSAKRRWFLLKRKRC